VSEAIEVLARGVLIQNDRILLCRSLAQGHAYLPGGHVEFGESIACALVREIKEELGVALDTGELLGLLEYAFHDGKERHAELNVLFLLQGEVASLLSREPEIEFFWHPLSQLGSIPFLPRPLVALLPPWLHDPQSTRFASFCDA
jgi:ADP-ribose pyrophosphatase YjhB (NUDIX family)